MWREFFPYCVVVTGSRHWTDYKKMSNRLMLLPQGTLIVEGGAPGADLMARNFALKRCWPFLEIPADWVKFGKPAGPRRNRQMLSLKPDLVLAFHEDISSSKGTKDCMDEAVRRQIPVELIA